MRAYQDGFIDKDKTITPHEAARLVGVTSSLSSPVTSKPLCIEDARVSMLLLVYKLRALH